MLPSQSKRSVPVLMPLKLTSTSMSAGSKGLSSRLRTESSRGASKTMACACGMCVPPDYASVHLSETAGAATMRR